MQICQVQPDGYYWLIVTDRKDQYYLYFPVKTFFFQNKIQKKLVGVTDLIVHTQHCLQHMLQSSITPKQMLSCDKKSSCLGRYL